MQRVSLGICVRNCEDYLREALNSIADQTYPHSLIELVIVDDGSEDGTLSIVKENVSKLDITAKIFHTSWKGLGHARNMVVANAEGDLILWVDGDMVLSKDYVAKLVEFMDRHPEVGIAKGKQALEPGGNTLATLEGYSRAAGRMVNYRSKQARMKSLGTGGAIYRVEALEKVGGFDERLRGYGEDQDVEIRIRNLGWLLDTVDVKFTDYERHALTWKSLWRRYWLRGYQTRYFLQKNKRMIRHYRNFPPAAFFSGLSTSFVLFKLTHERAVFLLAFISSFKMTAWYVGFVRNHFDFLLFQTK